MRGSSLNIQPEGNVSFLHMRIMLALIENPKTVKVGTEVGLLEKRTLTAIACQE